MKREANPGRTETVRDRGPSESTYECSGSWDMCGGNMAV